MIHYDPPLIGCDHPLLFRDLPPLGFDPPSGGGSWCITTKGDGLQLGVVDHDLGVADNSGSCLGVMDHDLGVVDHDLEVVDHGESQWIMTQA